MTLWLRGVSLFLFSGWRGYYNYDLGVLYRFDILIIHNTLIVAYKYLFLFFAHY